jgi:MOSC domain-containing protein YiiM
MTVTSLFVKGAHSGALESVRTIAYDERGIQNNVACAPFRQVLIASQSVTAECGLRPGDLRENIVVDFDSLYELPSGTVVQIGRALIRLTFHCEPCKKILKLVEFDRILHKRGVFGTFLDQGTISVGDRFSVTEQKFEEIPYAVSDRIRWFLKKGHGAAAALDLVHTIGLPASYAGAMPRLLKKFSLSGLTPSPRSVND